MRPGSNSSRGQPVFREANITRSSCPASALSSSRTTSRPLLHGGTSGQNPTQETGQDAPMADSRIDFVTGAPAAGSMEVRWIHGAPGRRRSSDPQIQVHHYDQHTVILRESKSVNYEAPFLYLLFGNDRALLLD